MIICTKILQILIIVVSLYRKCDLIFCEKD